MSAEDVSPVPAGDPYRVEFETTEPSVAWST
jgi:hypothetical protein